MIGERVNVLFVDDDGTPFGVTFPDGGGDNWESFKHRHAQDGWEITAVLMTKKKTTLNLTDKQKNSAMLGVSSGTRAIEAPQRGRKVHRFKNGESIEG